MPDYRDLVSCPPGLVINSYGEGIPGLFTKPLQHLALSTAYKAIRDYQHRKYAHYPPPPRDRAVHSIFHLGDGWCISTESPRTVIERLVLRPDRTYTGWYYSDAAIAPPQAWEAVRRFAWDELNGTPYDYGQLLDFKIGQLLEEILPPPFKLDKLSLFDLGRNRKVCSVTCAALLLLLHKKSREYGVATRRPLVYWNGKIWQDIFVERTCPADVEYQCHSGIGYPQAGHFQAYDLLAS